MKAHLKCITSLFLGIKEGPNLSLKKTANKTNCRVVDSHRGLNMRQFEAPESELKIYI